MQSLGLHWRTRIGLAPARADLNSDSPSATERPLGEEWPRSVREVIDIDRFFLKITELHIFRDADDGNIVFWLVIAQAIVAARRIAEGKEDFSSVLADDSDPL